MKSYRDELKKCLEKVDVEVFTKFIYKYRRKEYYSWLCLSYAVKMITLCNLILDKPCIDEKAKNKAKELLKVYGI